MKISMRFLMSMVVLASAGVHAAYVTVGNPANAADVHGDGYGSVAYEYQINEYETTAGEYAAFLNAVDPAGTNPNNVYNSSMDSIRLGCQITYVSGAADGSKYDFSGRPSGNESDWTNRPVNYVSWYDAARYTNWLTTGDTETGVYSFSGPTTLDSIMDHQTAGATYGTAYFIPTEDEWYKAAYYDPSGVYYDYPTGSDTVPGYVNNSGGLSGGGVFVEGGVDPGNYATYDGDSGTDGIGSPYYRTNVGEWENSASPYGTFDQGGNLFEWNETFIGSSSRVLRGGTFVFAFNYLQAEYRWYKHPWEEHDYTGFRVASMTSVIPEPTSLGLLAVAGLGMVARRKRFA